MSVSMRIKAYILRRFTRKKSINFDIRKAKNILFLRYDRIGGMVITPDTSIVHIASAFNIPIVTIHEDNRDSYQLFAPTSKYSRTVFSEFSDRLDGYNVDKIIENSISLIAKK